MELQRYRIATCLELTNRAYPNVFLCRLDF